MFVNVGQTTQKKKHPKSKTRHTTESHLQQFKLSQVRRILQDNLLCYIISLSIVLLCSLCAVLSCLHFALFTAYTCSVVCCLASFTANACSVVFCLALFTLCCPVRLSVSPHTFWVCFVHCLRLLSCLLSCSAHCVLFYSTVRLFIMVGTKDKALWHWQWNRTGQTHSFMQLNKFCHSDCKEDHFNQSVQLYCQGTNARGMCHDTGHTHSLTHTSEHTHSLTHTSEQTHSLIHTSH